AVDRPARRDRDRRRRGTCPLVPARRGRARHRRARHARGGEGDQVRVAAGEKALVAGRWSPPPPPRWPGLMRTLQLSLDTACLRAVSRSRTRCRPGLGTCAFKSAPLGPVRTTETPHGSSACCRSPTSPLSMWPPSAWTTVEETQFR